MNSVICPLYFNKTGGGEPSLQTLLTVDDIFLKYVNRYKIIILC